MVSGRTMVTTHVHGFTTPSPTMQLRHLCALGALTAACQPSLAQRGPPAPSLDRSTWAVTSVDDYGTDWSASTLYLRTGPLDARGRRPVSGHFCWRSAHARGQEFVQGALNTRGGLQLDGHRLQRANAEMVLGHYAARLTGDRRRLVEGTWRSIDPDALIAPGNWTARRTRADGRDCRFSQVLPR